MPSGDCLPRTYPDPSEYAAPKKYVLVLSCVDYRLLDDLIRFLNHDNLTNRYYHASFAGAAMGLNAGAENDRRFKTAMNFAQWRQTFIDHVRAAVTLTEGKLSAIYIVQHEDCGAFNLMVDGFVKMSQAEQRHMNRAFAEELQEDIKKYFCTVYNPVGSGQKDIPAVHTFFMDLRGNVDLLDTWPRNGEIVDRLCVEGPCPCQCDKPKM